MHEKRKRLTARVDESCDPFPYFPRSLRDIRTKPLNGACIIFARYPAIDGCIERTFERFPYKQVTV